MLAHESPYFVQKLYDCQNLLTLVSMKSSTWFWSALLFIVSAFCTGACGPKQTGDSPIDEDESGWVSLFDGHSLTGWTPKFSGRAVGENVCNIFRAEEGLLRVTYTDCDTFDGTFGHLFYQTPFSSYRLELEYRFTGEQARGGPQWAFRNNGVMVHSQSAESMGLDQDFPVSIEVQLLGGDGTSERPTGNLCTPGTHVTLSDTLATQHCIMSSSPTFQGDQWVHLALIVTPDQQFYHLINGDTVMHYRDPVIGGDFLPEGYPVAVGSKVTSGYIALQAETAPSDFRNIRISPLK